MTLQTEIFNSLFENSSINDRLFEKKIYTDTPASNFIQDQASQPNKITFSTLNLKDCYLIPRQGYIELHLLFRGHGSEKYCVRNHVASLFDSIEVQISDSDNKIEELRFCEHWSNIIGLIKWSEDYAGSIGLESNFSKDRPYVVGENLSTALSADSFDKTKPACNRGLIEREMLINSHKMVATLYLKDLPFFESYYGIFTKARFKIILTPNYTKPIVSMKAGINYLITKADMIIPEVFLMPEAKLKLLEMFNSGFSKMLRWQSLDCYQSPEFALGTTNIQWTISSEIKKPSWVYIILVQNFPENDYHKYATQIYNAANISSYSLLINNKECFAESNVDFEALKCHRLYNHLKNCMNHFNDRESQNTGSQVSFIDFCKHHRILAFDLNDVDAFSVYNSRSDQTVSVVFKCSIAALGFPLVLYAFIQREKEIVFNYKADKLDISLNNI